MIVRLFDQLNNCAFLHWGGSVEFWKYINSTLSLCIKLFYL